MEKTVKHFCTTANRIKTDSAEFIKNVDWKKVGTGLGVTAVATGLVVITGGAAGPIILGALIGGGSSAAINGAVTALNGGSIADVAKSASDGFMWGTIGGAAGGAVGSSLSPVINRVFGNGLTAALVNGGLSGAAGGGLTGGMESGAAGNDIGRVLEDAAKGVGVGAAIGAASAGIGYGIKSLGSGGTTGSGGESTATVWDNIASTADDIPATDIPATFKIDLDGNINYVNPETGTNMLWTNSNATKHMGEYVSRFGDESWSIGIRSQAMLESYSASLNKAMETIVTESPGRYFGIYGNWELGVNTETGVVYHARMLN